MEHRLFFSQIEYCDNLIFSRRAAVDELSQRLIDANRTIGQPNKITVIFGRKVQKWDQLDPNLQSFAHMAVAALVGCSWCLDLNYFHAHNEGLDEAKASQVPRWRESPVFTPLERDVMEYAEAMSETPPRVTDDLSARLLEQLGAPAMVELTAWVAFANMATRCNTALGIEAQGFSKACKLPLAQPSARYATSA